VNGNDELPVGYLLKRAEGDIYSKRSGGTRAGPSASGDSAGPGW
jgi:hypothetical protein